MREFLAFSRPHPLEPRPVDVAELAAGVAGLIAPEAEAAHVAVTVDVPAGHLARARRSGAPAPGAAQPHAQRAARRWPIAAATCGCGARNAGANVEIDVEDDGPGFAEDLPVFDAFFTTKEHGTGLGLSLVHRIVADHGGTIRVESRPGRTCFTLTLPAAR